MLSRPDCCTFPPSKPPRKHVTHARTHAFAGCGLDEISGPARESMAPNPGEQTQMKPELLELASRIQERFPFLDVRSDQCDTIRIISAGTLVDVTKVGNELKAAFVSLKGKCDFETTVRDVLVKNNLAEFEKELIDSLGKM
jgi:hypothetical protein